MYNHMTYCLDETGMLIITIEFIKLVEYIELKLVISKDTSVEDYERAMDVL